MAISTAKRREEALLLGGPLTPDGGIDEADWAALLEQYGGFYIISRRTVAFNLYFERARVVMTGVDNEADGMKIERSRALDLYVERSRAASLNLT